MEFEVEIEDNMTTSLEYLFEEKSMELLTVIGQDAVFYSEQAFEQQGLHKKGAWRKPSPVNFTGIFADANENREIPERRIDPARPALVNTGLARRSITFEVESSDSVRIGTSLEYMRLHQEGGHDTILKTNDKKAFKDIIDRFMKAYGGRLTEYQKQVIRNMISTERWEYGVPKREFLGYSAQRGVELIKDFINDGRKESQTNSGLPR